MSSYLRIVQQIVARFRDIEAKTILIVARFSTIKYYNVSSGNVTSDCKDPHITVDCRPVLIVLIFIILTCGVQKEIRRKVYQKTASWCTWRFPYDDLQYSIL